MQQKQFTVNVSERSIRRVQVAMTAVQTCEQTAQAVMATAQNMLDQARKSLDEALGAICDAHNEQLPGQYTLQIKPNDGTLTITDATETPEMVSVEVGPPPDHEGNGLVVVEKADILE
jgi:hypothetical protein